MPEPSQRSHRHRSQPRSHSRRHAEPSRSPSLDPPLRRPHRNVRPSYSPTRSPSRERSERHRHEKELRSGSREPRTSSRPPSTSRGGSSSRGGSHGKSGKRPRVRFSLIDAEGAAEALTTRATRTGFLRKQADNEPGAWNEYYFVLKPLTYLFYYNTKDDETPRGIIDLEYLTDIKRNTDCLQRAVGGGDNCFRVSGKLPKSHGEPNANGDIPKMRPLYLDTDDDEEAEKWMDAIRNHRFSLKKDEQFFEMVHHLTDAECQVSQLEAAQKKEADTKRTLRVKAHKLLQRMRTLESGNADSIQDDEFDPDDGTLDMLSSLEAMEDVMVDMEAKMEQQKQQIAKLKESNAEKDQKLIAGTTSSRRNRGFTQVLQRAVSRYDNDRVEESEEEESPPVSRRAQKSRDDPPSTRDKSVSDVQAVCAMWNKKKKSPTQPSVLEDDSSEEADSRNYKNRTAPRSGRSMTTAVDTSSTPQTTASVRKFVAALQNRAVKNDRESEEDTVSIDSSDDRRSGEEAEENLPAGWTKHESRGFPGSYYFAHDTGVTSWDVPTENTLRELGGEPAEEDPAEEGRTPHDRAADNRPVSNRAAENRAAGNGAANNRAADTRPANKRAGAVSSRGVNNRPANTRAVRHSARADNDSYVESSGDDLSELESDEDAGGATSSAAYRVKKPKAKSAWTFKLPKLLPTTNPAPATEVTSSLSPIARGTNHHEF